MKNNEMNEGGRKEENKNKITITFLSLNGVYTCYQNCKRFFFFTNKVYEWSAFIGRK